MPQNFYGPYGEQYKDYANAGNANLGRFPLGHTLILPDGRTYKFTLNDATVEVAGRMYQSVASVTNHTNVAADVARAIGATAVSATLGATAAAVDIYAEGVLHTNNLTGEGYSYRIRRAMTAGAAHAAAATSSILTVNLDSGESVQVALDTTSSVSFTRNRFHQALITASPPTAMLTGVSPGVAAANRFYWSQVKGYAAVLAAGTLLAGLPVQATAASGVAGSVENVKRRIQTAASTGSVLTAGTALVRSILDQDGNASGLLAVSSVSTATVYDASGGTANNAPVVGMCVKANADTDEALIDLDLNII